MHKRLLHMCLYLIELSKICKSNGKVEVSSEIERSVSVIGKPNSKAVASVKREFNDRKEKQIQDAVQWVHVHFGSCVGKRALKETIINTAKKVGITVTGLDVNSLQQDKFEQASDCMTEVKQKSSESANKTPEKISVLSLNTNAIVPMTLNSLTKSARAKHRFGTVA